MNVLVIGSGGREHALCDVLKKSTHLEALYAIPGNPGISELATCVDIDPMDNDSIVSFAQEHDISLIIPGSEVYLANGIENACQGTGILVFGPSKEAAQIETSKQFAKNIMKQYNIPTAQYEVFQTFEPAWKYVQEKGVPIVIKYDGLAGGKGVVVAMTLDEAKHTLQDMLQSHTYGNDAVVIEEYLEGPEFSLMCFVHGETIVPMPIAQDHKRLLDNDEGPNTGGMGIYSPVPIISDVIVEEAMETIMKPIIRALQQENVPYKGFLYGGLMATKDGPKVIEFNARFGDPEAEVILPKLQTDILDIIPSVLYDNPVTVQWDNQYVVGVVMASKGYPKTYQKGYPIEHLHIVPDMVYHMGTKQQDETIVTNGGRVLLVTGTGYTLQQAIQAAYHSVDIIECENLIYRTDIGYKSL